MNPRRKPLMPPSGPRLQNPQQGKKSQYGYYPYHHYYYPYHHYYDYDWPYYHHWYDYDYDWYDYDWYDYDYYYRAEKKPQRKNRPAKQIQTIAVDVPLMIRLLEFAREDTTSDMDLHEVVERMIELSEYGESLTMEEYTDIVDIEEYSGQPDQEVHIPQPPPPPVPMPMPVRPATPPEAPVV